MYAPEGYIFVCGYDHQSWAYECLDSWKAIGGMCFSCFLCFLAFNILFNFLKMATTTTPESYSRRKRALSIIDDYPDEELFEYEDNSCGHSQGCDLPARYSGDQFNQYLGIINSWLEVDMANLEVMMRNHVNRRARSTA